MADPLRPLDTPRLTLRPARISDRADLIALEADPEVMRYLNGGAPVPPEGLPDADFLTPRGGEREVLVARDRASGTFIGWFALFDDGQGQAELGYRLARTAWGRGLGTEGATALLAEAFGRLGFATVRAETHADNRASRALLEKLGFDLLEIRPGPSGPDAFYARRRPPSP